MFSAVLWVVIRSIIVPYLAFQFLKETMLGEQGALLAIGIALLIVTVISLIWNLLKLVGNTLLLRGKAALIILLKVGIQLFALAAIWLYYFAEYGG